MLSDGNEQADLTWMRWHCIVQRTTPVGTVEDRAGFKLDLLNITSGAVDSTWTSTDFTQAITPIDTFLTAIKLQTTPAHSYVEHVVYGMRFNPADPGPIAPGVTPRPFLNTGPPIYRTPATQVGQAGLSVLPYQTACSITFRTAWPKHWGRIFPPGLTPTLTANGRWTTSGIQNIANAARAMGSGLADRGFLLVTPVSQLDKQPFHALLGVTDYVVDDVPDVIRRRRPKQASVRALGV